MSYASRSSAPDRAGILVSGLSSARRFALLAATAIGRLFVYYEVPHTQDSRGRRAR